AVRRQEAPLHAGGEARAAPAAEAGVLHGLDDLVRLHPERLAQRPVAAAALVALAGERVGLVPVPGEDRCQGGHLLRPSWLPGLASPGIGLPGSCGGGEICSGRTGSSGRSRSTSAGGASQPRSRASSSPRSDSGPACTPSPARPSGKPARMRDASRHVARCSGPRVGSTGRPARRSSTSFLAFSGVMLSNDSQLTIITGAKSQAALHSIRSMLTLPSGVVSSLPSPVCSLSSSQIWSPPMMARRVLMQTPTWYSPTGFCLYCV